MLRRLTPARGANSSFVNLKIAQISSSASWAIVFGARVGEVIDHFSEPYQTRRGGMLEVAEQKLDNKEENSRMRTMRTIRQKRRGHYR